MIEVVKAFFEMLVAIIKAIGIVVVDCIDWCVYQYTHSKSYINKRKGTIAIYIPKEKPLHIIMRHAKQIKPSAALSCCLIIAMGIMCFSMYGKLNNIQNEMETAIYYSPDFIEEEEVMVYSEEGELTIEPTTTITEPPTATEAAITEATTTEVITTTNTNAETSSSTNTTTTATTTQQTNTTTSAPPPTTTTTGNETPKAEEVTNRDVGIVQETPAQSAEATPAQAAATPVENTAPDNPAGRTYEVSEDIAKFIAKYEGRKGDEPYKCESDCWTIGYGHAFTSAESREWSKEKAIEEFNKDIERALGKEHCITGNHPRLSDDEAMRLLRYDLSGNYKTKLDEFIKKNGLILNQQQYDALISFAYNCGAGVWTKKNFKFRDSLVHYKDGSKIPRETVRDQLDNWCHGANGKELPGLTRRRRNEAKLFSTGSYAIIANKNDY